MLTRNHPSGIFASSYSFSARRAQCRNIKSVFVIRCFGVGAGTTGKGCNRNPNPERLLPPGFFCSYKMSKYPNRVEHIETDGFEYLSICDRHRGKLPKKSAVYCLIMVDYTGEFFMYYVGKTSDISQRLKYPHSVEAKIYEVLDAYVLFTHDIDQIEIDFIKRYRPILNKQHNGAS